MALICCTEIAYMKSFYLAQKKKVQGAVKMVNISFVVPMTEQLKSLR